MKGLNTRGCRLYLYAPMKSSLFLVICFYVCGFVTSYLGHARKNIGLRLCGGPVSYSFLGMFTYDLFGPVSLFKSTE